MAFDGLVTKSIVEELSGEIQGGKIQKIYQPTKNEILLSIYAKTKQYALRINIDSACYRIHLTTHVKVNPLNAPNFCMLLRKHILGYRIKGISNNGLERIIKIQLEGYDELKDLVIKTLIIELMGKHSNIILLNKDNRIIDSVRHLDKESGSYRDILPAREYVFPNNEKKDFFKIKDANEFKQILVPKLSEQSLEKAVTETFDGFSKGYIQYKIEEKQLLKKDTPIEILFEDLKQITEKIGSKEVGLIQWENQKGKKDYAIGLKEKHMPLFINFAIDDFYAEKEEKEQFSSFRTPLLKLILEKLQKDQIKLKHMKEKLEECEKSSVYQLYGELITANLYRIEEGHFESVTLENYYEENKPIVIPLDKKKMVLENAKQYFKKYRKAQNAMEIVARQKSQTEKELQYIESIIYELEEAKTIQDVNTIYSELVESGFLVEKPNDKKGKQKEEKAPFLSCMIDGFLVWIGKNNKQNDELTTKFAKKEDIWFHTKDIHGSHVILQVPSKETKISIKTLEKVAQIAAFHSKAKLSQNVPVDYCQVKFVKKPTGSKPGMVIYSHNKTLYVMPKEEKKE